MDSYSHKKPGRPSLPPEQRRDRTLRIRMTDDELKRLGDASRFLGLCDSEFVRDVILREAERVENVATRIEQRRVAGRPGV